MATKTLSTLDDLLLEQSMDHILNSPDDEFIQFVAENGLDIEDLKSLNKRAGETALKSAGISLEKSTEVKVETEPFVDKLVAAAKRLNFSLTKKDFQDWSEDSLHTHISYSRSQKDKRTNIRKRK